MYGWDEVLVLPYTVLGATDSKHFLNLTEATYRMGQRLGAEQIDTIHGVDERETAEGLAEQVCVCARVRAGRAGAGLGAEQSPRASRADAARGPRTGSGDAAREIDDALRKLPRHVLHVSATLSASIVL